MHHHFPFFLSLLLVALIAHGTLWQHLTFTDEELWTARITQLHHDLTYRHHDGANPVYSGHPGMTVVTLGALAHAAGSSLPASLRGSVTVFVALSVATAALLCRWLRPQTLWWLPVSAFLLFHPLYVQASPVNAVIAPLAVVMVLLGLWLFEHPLHQRVVPFCIAFGASIGLAASTRLVTAVLIAIPLLVVLLPRLGSRLLVLIGGTSVAMAIASDPLMWFTPVEHVRFILFRSSINYTGALVSHSLTLSEFLLFAPLGLLSIVFAVLSLGSSRRSTLVPPVPWLLMLFALTGVFSGAFLSVRFQSLRHFLPLIFVWEAFLPLFLLHFTYGVRQAWRSVLGISIVAVLIAGQFFLLLSSL